jgi:hypothetical protein
VQAVQRLWQGQQHEAAVRSSTSMGGSIMYSEPARYSLPGWSAVCSLVAVSKPERAVAPAAGVH